MNGNYDRRLPTAEEYRKSEGSTLLEWSSWPNPKYICPCGGNMHLNLTLRFNTDSEVCMYRCDKCGHVEYQFV